MKLHTPLWKAWFWLECLWHYHMTRQYARNLAAILAEDLDDFRCRLRAIGDICNPRPHTPLWYELVNGLQEVEDAEHRLSHLRSNLRLHKRGLRCR